MTIQRYTTERKKENDRQDFHDISHLFSALKEYTMNEMPSCHKNVKNEGFPSGGLSRLRGTGSLKDQKEFIKVLLS
jgi:hypothetical protein